MTPSPTFTRAALALVTLGGALAACDLQMLGDQATARTVAVSTLLYTPPIEVKGRAIAFNGLDASIPGFDAGVLTGLDAGALLGDAGALLADAGIVLTGDGLIIPAQNLAFVFFGQRQGESLQSAPVGTPGATATLKQAGGPSFQLTDQGGGAYAMLPDAGFVYQEGATYQFEFGFEGKTYVAQVDEVPRNENIPQFHPAEGYIELDAGTGFFFTRPDPSPDKLRNFGFVNVFPISISGGQGQPTYTNIPTSALGFLKLVVAPTEWQRTRVDIPGSAFPDPDTNYVVVLQSAKLGLPLTNNLFAGSAILAGTADVAIVKTRK